MSDKGFLIILGCCVCVTAVIGCKRQDPVYATDVNLGSDSQPLMPTDLHYIYEDQSARGRVSDPDLSHLVPKAVQDVAVQADSADQPAAPAGENNAIRAAFSEVVELVAEGELDDVPTYFVPDQGDQLDKFLPILKPLLAKASAWDKAFGAEGAPAMIGGMPADPKAVVAMLKPLLSAATISTTDDSHAAMVINFPMMGDPVEIPFTKIDDQWYIEIPGFPEASVLEAVRSGLLQAMPAVLQKMDELMAKSSDETMTAQLAQIELMQAFMPIQQFVMQAIAEANPENLQDSGEAEEDIENSSAKAEDKSADEAKKPESDEGSTADEGDP